MGSSRQLSSMERLSSERYYRRDETSSSASYGRRVYTLNSSRWSRTEPNVNERARVTPLTGPDKSESSLEETASEKPIRVIPLITPERWGERFEENNSGRHIRVRLWADSDKSENNFEERDIERSIRVTPWTVPERSEEKFEETNFGGYARVTPVRGSNTLASDYFPALTKPKEEDSFATETANVCVMSDVCERHHHIWQKIAIPSTESTTRPDNRSVPRVRWSNTLERIFLEYQRTGKFYEDEEFPADDSSLFINAVNKPKHQIEWKRPWEIRRNPKFFNGELNQHDVVQGSIKNCWLVSAISNLSLHKELLYQVCPPNQSFNKEDYCGAFLFRFWHFGEWIEVVVDDRLPTYNNGQLYFAKSKDPNEFWSALLEKAYCKKYENYELLNLGLQSEALQDFTGGLVRTIDLSETKSNLYSELKNVADRNSLMGASIELSDTQELELRTKTGLVRGHAYTITGLTKVTLENTHNRPQVELIRLRNPWGDSAEWKMAWSDRSTEWNMLSSEQRKEMGLVFENDGEFWMSLSDFAENFTSLAICMLAPMSLTGSDKTEWHVSKETGRWRAGHNAGGCRNYENTFHINPQFRIKLEDSHKDEEEHGKCSIVIDLMRKNSNRNFERTDSNTRDTPPVGFAVYKCPEVWPVGEKLGSSFFKRSRAVGMTTKFTREREIMLQFELPPGEYVIVPSTFKPHQEADFLLRIFTEKPIHKSIVDEETALLGSIRPSLSPADSQRLNKQLFPLFKATVGKDDWIDQIELQTLLNHFMGKAKDDTNGISLETSRSIISMLDKGKTGTLTFSDLKEVWQFVQLWQNTFDKFDRDNCGEIETVVLRDALREMNFSLSNNVMEAVVVRYNNKKGKISFETFMSINVALIRSFESFEELTQGWASGRTKKVVFTLDELLTTTLSI